MNIDEMLDGRAPPARHVVGWGVRPWLNAAAAFGIMAALFDPAIALAQADACPNKGGTLTFARSADVSGWYYQDNNPTIWAWPLVSLALVRNKVDASGLEGAAAEILGSVAELEDFHVPPSRGPEVLRRLAAHLG